uniref:Uncharacterized protein n=1 Tax=Anguilla anguilla TaxID=7936 RepID=A0A0E9TY03_ANGAN
MWFLAQPNMDVYFFLLIPSLETWILFIHFFRLNI